jgi:phosphopantetheinyl transferase
LLFAVATTPSSLSELDSNELEHLWHHQTPQERRSYLTGRLALRRLLAKVGRSEPAGQITFPNPWMSLSHSGDIALAVGLAESACPLVGVGLNLTWHQETTPSEASSFLHADELLWLNQQPVESRKALARRLWTIKNALCKSDPHRGQAQLSDYVTINPGARSGRAVRTDLDNGMSFSYASSGITGGLLAAAVMRIES